MNLLISLSIAAYDVGYWQHVVGGDFGVVQVREAEGFEFGGFLLSRCQAGEELVKAGFGCDRIGVVKAETHKVGEAVVLVSAQEGEAVACCRGRCWRQA